MFGQYGFKGQAVLFAMDIHEVRDHLLTTLPRSTTETGLVVVVERLETVNVIRESRIYRERVFVALRWLVANNPLYSDVVVDEGVEFDEDHLIRRLPSQYEIEEGCFMSSYKRINGDCRIIRSSWHEGTVVSVLFLLWLYS